MIQICLYCFKYKQNSGNNVVIWWQYYPRIFILSITLCLTSCRPVVRALVYQPSGPGLIPGMSRSESTITRRINPNDAAATYQVFVNYMLTLMIGKKVKNIRFQILIQFCHIYIFYKILNSLLLSDFAFVPTQNTAVILNTNPYKGLL